MRHDVVAVDLGVGAESGELLDGAETRLEEVLRDHGRARRPRRCRTARRAAGRSGSPGRAGSRRRRPAGRRSSGRDPEAALGDLDVAAGLLERAQRSTQVLGDAADDLDVAARRRGGEGPGAGRDAVGDDGVLGRGERLDAVDGDAGRAGALDAGAHRDEHLGDVDDLGLLGDVVDRRRAARQHRRGEDVLGGARRSGSRGGCPRRCRPPGARWRRGSRASRAPRRRGPRGRPRAGRARGSRWRRHRGRRRRPPPPGPRAGRAPRWRRAGHGRARSRRGDRCARARRARRRRPPAS